MADDSPTSNPASQTTRAAAHLARVRDNQRRSRARRKEYLLELEEKFRRCEQSGVEASAEMQAAARRVLEENATLRAFLREHGHTDEELDAYTASSRAGDELTGAGGRRDNPPQQSAVQGLEGMLNSRRSCNLSEDQSRSSSEPLRRLSTTSSSAQGPMEGRTAQRPSRSSPTSQQYQQLPLFLQQQQQHQHQQRQEQHFFMPTQPHQQIQNPQQHLQQSFSSFQSTSTSPSDTEPIYNDNQSLAYPNYVAYPTTLSHAESSQQSQLRRRSQQQQQQQQQIQIQQRQRQRTQTRHPQQHPQPQPNILPPQYPQSTASWHPSPSQSSHPSGYPINQPLPPSHAPPPSYHPSPMQSTIPSPHAFFNPDAPNPSDATTVDDVSELLLAPELQAQFLRGLGRQHDAYPSRHPPSSMHQSAAPSRSAAVAEQRPWKMENDQGQGGDEYDGGWVEASNRGGRGGDGNDGGRGMAEREGSWQRW